MAPESSTFATFIQAIEQLLVFACVLGGIIALFWSPFALYRRYREKNPELEGFSVARVERDEQGPFRSGEQRYEVDVVMSPSGEWAAKIGFFLGILGFLWTPLVLMGIAAKLMPMVTVGLPGLVVSWSLFFASRSYLKGGVKAAGLMRFAAVSEIALNVWVLALVVLVTMHDSSSLSESSDQLLRAALLVPGARHEGIDAYEVAYSIQKAGLVSVAYAALSLVHARLLLNAWAPLSRAERWQRSGGPQPV